MFTSGPYFHVIAQSLRHLREHRGLALHACVIMPTHLHAVVTALHDDLSDIMRDFKKFTSRALYQCAEQSGDDLLPWLFRQAARNQPHSRFKVWQDEFHPKMLFSEDGVPAEGGVRPHEPGSQRTRDGARALVLLERRFLRRQDGGPV